MENQKQRYLEDTVIPESEGRVGVFDLDQEFGEGMGEEILESGRGLADGYKNLSSQAAWRYAIFQLLGIHYGDPDARKRGLAATRIEYSQYTTPGKATEDPYLAGFKANQYAILTGDRIDHPEIREASLRALENAHDNFDLKWQEKSALELAHYRLLGGKRPRSQYEAAAELLKDMIVKRKTDDRAQLAAMYRVLKAKSFRFVPGQGIEVVDPSSEFEKEMQKPLPEQRAF